MLNKGPFVSVFSEAFHLLKLDIFKARYCIEITYYHFLNDDIQAKTFLSMKSLCKPKISPTPETCCE